MFTTILVLAMTAGGESADFGRRGGCNGCSGGCYGSNGCSGGCSGGLFGGLFGRKNHGSHGCNGCGGGVYHGCSGCNGCGGGVVYHGCGGCGGGVVQHGCGGGGVIYRSGCGGGVIVHSGCCGGTVIPTVPTVPSTDVPKKRIEGGKEKGTGDKPDDGIDVTERGKKPVELTPTEAKWLKEMVDGEKDPAEKKRIEKEFKAEKTGAAREAYYNVWKKSKDKDSDA